MNRIIPIFLFSIFFSCSTDRIDKKGFPVSEPSADGEEIVDGLTEDTLVFKTKPRNVLLTTYPEHRLTPIYKVNYHKENNRPFTGSNRYHFDYWGYGNKDGNNWNNNFMPGFEAIYGYNFVNISHFNQETKEENIFFEKPVLIKTFYYPAFSNDTLKNTPISRAYYMVSAYDEDTNKDGFVNVKDLRRLYYFDLNATNKSLLIPNNYSVMNSEYDPENDLMYIFATLDENENGQMEYEEESHIFWIDLKNPENRGIQFKGK